MNNEEKQPEIRKCRNKKCQRELPEGYKYKYCENCRNEHAEKAKSGMKLILGTVASAAVFVVTKGKFGNIGGKDV